VACGLQTESSVMCRTLAILILTLFLSAGLRADDKDPADASAPATSDSSAPAAAAAPASAAPVVPVTSAPVTSGDPTGVAPVIQPEPEPVMFRGSLATPFNPNPIPFPPPKPGLITNLKAWGYDKAQASGEYLFAVAKTGGLRIVFRRPTEAELKELEKPYADAWQKDLPKLKWGTIGEHAWPYQWPIRLGTRLTVGKQKLITPVHGTLNTIDRFTCSKVAERITGKFVITNPVRFAVAVPPVIAGFMAINAGANLAQSHWLEHLIQGPRAPFLDEQIKHNLLMKPIRSAMDLKQIDQAEARRLAYKVLKESETLTDTVSAYWPKDPNDPVEGEAMVELSLPHLTFADLDALNDTRELTTDENTHLYYENFSPIVSDEQILKLVMNRHFTILRMAGGEALLNEISKKNPNLKVGRGAEKVRESRSVKAVLAKFKEGKINEDEARKWIHVYLDFEQEIRQGEILGYAKRSVEQDIEGSDFFSDNPLTLDQIETEIIGSLPK